MVQTSPTVARETSDVLAKHAEVSTRLKQALDSQLARYARLAYRLPDSTGGKGDQQLAGQRSRVYFAHHYRLSVHEFPLAAAHPTHLIS